MDGVHLAAAFIGTLQIPEERRTHEGTTTSRKGCNDELFKRHKRRAPLLKNASDAHKANEQSEERGLARPLFDELQRLCKLFVLHQ